MYIANIDTKKFVGEKSLTLDAVPQTVTLAFKVQDNAGHDADFNDTDKFRLKITHGNAVIVNTDVYSFKDGFLKFKDAAFENITSSSTVSDLLIERKETSGTEYVSILDDTFTITATIAGGYTDAQIDSFLLQKVDKVEGKALSENDYTDTDKSKLDGIDLTDYAKTADLAAVATSGSYSDLANKPENVTTQGNTFNGANQLVQLDATAKIPEALYERGDGDRISAYVGSVNLSYPAGTTGTVSGNILKTYIHPEYGVPEYIEVGDSKNGQKLYLKSGNEVDVVMGENGVFAIGSEEGGKVLTLSATELNYNNNQLNTANGLVKLGDDGKIPETLYSKGDFLPLTGGTIDGELEVTGKIETDSTATFNTNVIVEGTLNTNAITLNNAEVNTANGLVKLGSDGKIPEDLYVSGGGGTYTAGNGISITDNEISVNKSTVFSNGSDGYALHFRNNGSHKSGIVMSDGSGASGTGTVPEKALQNIWYSTAFYGGWNENTAAGLGVSGDGFAFVHTPSYRSNSGSNYFRHYITGKDGFSAILPELCSGGTVTSSYTIYVGYNVHTITTTADTDCTIVIDTYCKAYDYGYTIQLIVDNTAGANVMYGTTVILPNTCKNKYLFEFMYLGSTDGWQIKRLNNSSTSGYEQYGIRLG